MRPERREVLALLLRSLAWLPACLAAWYFASPVLSWIPARLAAPVVAAFSGPTNRLELSAERAGYELAIAAPYRPGVSGEEAVVAIEVNPRLYTFGIALFLALSVASRGPRHPGAIAAAAGVLLVLPAWGIAFDALRQLGNAAELAPYLRWTPSGREAVAFGFQVGSLLLPSLAPVAAWLATHPEVLRPPASRAPG